MCESYMNPDYKPNETKPRHANVYWDSAGGQGVFRMRISQRKLLQGTKEATRFIKEISPLF